MLLVTEYFAKHINTCISIRNKPKPVIKHIVNTLRNKPGCPGLSPLARPIWFFNNFGKFGRDFSSYFNFLVGYIVEQPCIGNFSRFGYKLFDGYIGLKFYVF